MNKEKLPVHEVIKVIDYETIFKSDKWWSCVTLQESFNKKQVAVYLWQKDTKKKSRWKRKQKMIIPKQNWGKIKEGVDKFIDQL